MSTVDKFRAAMRELPLVAILRGLKPAEAPAIGDVLVEAGFRLIEVPLNSPQPLESIALLRKRFPDAVIGAGTVLTAAEARDVASAGGELVVAPNFDREVVVETVRLGMASVPGIMTPTEAFAALARGRARTEAVSGRAGLARRREGAAGGAAEGHAADSGRWHRRGQSSARGARPVQRASASARRSTSRATMRRRCGPRRLPSCRPGANKRKRRGNMKIKSYEIFRCDAGWRMFSFLKVVTDNGLVGWSEYNESFGSHGLSGVIEALMPIVIGKDPMDIELMNAVLATKSTQSRGGVMRQAVAAIENALLDIKGKALGVPVYQLFGGAARPHSRLLVALRHAIACAIRSSAGCRGCAPTTISARPAKK